MRFEFTRKRTSEPHTRALPPKTIGACLNGEGKARPEGRGSVLPRRHRGRPGGQGCRPTPRKGARKRVMFLSVFLGLGCWVVTTLLVYGEGISVRSVGTMDDALFTLTGFTCLAYAQLHSLRHKLRCS